MHGRGMEEPRLSTEVSVGTQGPGQTGTAACAILCYLLLLCNLGICANLKRPSCRLYSHSITFKQLSMKIVAHINITLWSKTFTLRTFLLM